MRGIIRLEERYIVSDLGELSIVSETGYVCAKVLASGERFVGAWRVKEVTLKDIRSVQAHKIKTSRNKIKQCLNSLGVSRTSELKPSQYIYFMQFLKQL